MTESSQPSARRDENFMQHALDLARKGVGLASPNPAVGCVLVRDGEIVGEGFHQYDALDHAEIIALNAAAEKSHGATLYVTLEPCNHTGRTGPCTEAIISARVRRVVAATEDPNPKNSGSGFERLRAAGTEVTTGIHQREAQQLNEGFARWIRTGRPFVTLKSALTLDGQLVLPGQSNALASKNLRLRKKPAWITSEESRSEVQRMRHASDAVLTGIGTVQVDDPLLTDRSGLPRRRPLLRVIVDSSLGLSPSSRLVRSGKGDILVFTNAPENSLRARALRRAGVDLIHASSRGRRLNLSQVMTELGRREILNVLLEAGPTLNGSTLLAGLVDKLALFYAPKVAGETRVPFALAPGLQLPALHSQTVRSSGPDFLVEGYLTNVYGNHRT